MAGGSEGGRNTAVRVSAGAAAGASAGGDDDVIDAEYEVKE